MVSAKKKSYLVSLAVLFIALSMRGPTGCVGPLVSAVQSDLSLNSTVAGLLTTLPLIAFAITAPLAGRIVRGTDDRVIACICLVLNIGGMLLRSAGTLWALLAGTVLLGFGTGVLNVFMPAFIRNRFPNRTPLMMSVYSTAMPAASAFFAGTCLKTAALLGGWQRSMELPAILSVLALISVALAGPCIAGRLPFDSGRNAGDRIVNRRSIPIALYTGLQSLCFFSATAWLPSIAKALCPAMENSGSVITLFQLVSLIPSFALPLLYKRAANKKLLTLGMTALLLPGLFCIVFSGGHLWLILLGSALFGMATGGTMSLVLTFLSTYGTSGGDTARITGFAQCVGYVIAAVGPSGLGFVFDHTGSWMPVLWLLVGVAVLMLFLGQLIERQRA